MSESYNLDQPWERQPFDTDASWRAFVVYRDLPQRPRKYKYVAAALGLTRPAIAQQASRCAWRERAAEFDSYIDRQKTALIIDAMEEDARAIANRHLHLISGMLQCAETAVAGWLQRIQNGDKLDEWTPTEVRMIIKDLVTLERVIRGDATERVEVNVGFDLSRLSIQELEQFRALEEKAQKR